MKPTNTALCLKHLRSAPAHSRMAADGCHASQILAVGQNFRFQIAIYYRKTNEPVFVNADR